MKKRGRPKGSGKYYAAFRLRLDKDEYIKLTEISKSEGTSVSKTMRALISDYISNFKEGDSK